jgi:hypothetical protein
MHSFETHLETFQSQTTRHLRVTEAGALERIGTERALPKAIRVDNGPEFISKVFDQ